MASARQDQNLPLFLKWLYPSERLLEVGDQLYPVALIQAPQTQWKKPESVLVSDGWQSRESIEPAILKSGEDFLALRDKSFEKIWDSDNFVMHSLQSEGRLAMRCGIGKYLDWLKTCGVLEMELLTKFHEDEPKPGNFESFSKKLELRRLLHGESLRKPWGLSMTIGATTLLVFRQGKQFKTILRERSGRVATLPGMVGVIPSSTFEATVGDYDNEFSIKHNFYREYLEELFSKEEVIEPTNQLAFDYFFSDPNLRFLRKLEAQKKAEFLFTGFAIDLIRLTPEICTLMLIQSEEWIEKHRAGIPEEGISKLMANWEYKTKNELSAAGRESRSLVDLTGDLGFPIGADFQPSRISPPSAAALSMGLDVARRTLGIP
jgi:hypothetical protein